MKDNSSNNIEVIDQELSRLQENPEDLVPDLEKDRFKGYCDRWRRQKKIGEVWREADIFFPLFFSNGFYKKLRQVSAENFDLYMKALSSIDQPCVLYDILARQDDTNDGWSTMVKVLKESAKCKKKDDDLDDDIDSVLAPVVIHVLVDHILYSVESPSDASRYIEQITEVLQNRADGFYLSYHYVKYLLWRDWKREDFNDLLEILSCGFEEKAKKCVMFDGKVKVEGLKDLSDNTAKDFMATGILNTVEGTDVLLNFRTISRFMQEDELKEQFWDAFKMVYSYEAPSFFTNDFNFHLKHFDICNLILSQKDVMQAWEEIDEMLQGSLHRLSVQYYGRQAMDLRSHINFVWAVNLQILEYLYKEDVILASKMWNRFWSGGLAYARRFADYQEDYVYQYMGRLISYYYVCFVKGESGIEEKEIGINGVCINKVMAKFKEIENMPILVLLSVRMLLDNGWAWQDIINGKYENFFTKAFDRAIELSVGQKKYEWVSSYLKKKGFVHKHQDKAM